MLDNARYQIELDIFEGPMDLLVHLIRKNEIDIHDIPISLITEQYLAYLDWMEQTRVSPAGDFLIMAATLVHIKSALLIPRPAAEAGADDDPRMEIVRPLTEYLAMKKAAGHLAKRPVLGTDVFIRPANFRQDGHQIRPLCKCDIMGLLKSYTAVISSQPEAHLVSMTAPRLSVKHRIQELLNRFKVIPMIRYHELAPASASRTEQIITFLALLEMAKQNLVRIRRIKRSGVLRVFSFIGNRIKT